jgi:hypothetical protein
MFKRTHLSIDAIREGDWLVEKMDMGQVVRQYFTNSTASVSIDRRDDRSSWEEEAMKGHGHNALKLCASIVVLLFLLLRLFLPLPLTSLAYFFIFFRFSGFRPYGPRPSSSFTSYRPDEATKPTTSPRCPFSFLALRLCSSTRVPMGMCAEGEGEAVGVADDDGADACC